MAMQKFPNRWFESWTQLIHDYLRGRVTLKRVFLLIDSRHGVKKNDQEIMSLMDKAAVSYQLVLTKSDKIKSSDAVVDQTTTLIKRHPAAYPEVLLTSSQKHLGLDRLRSAAAKAIDYRS